MNADGSGSDPDPEDREWLEASGIDPDAVAIPRKDALAPLSHRAFARAVDLLVAGIIGLAFTIPTSVEVDGTDQVSSTGAILALVAWIVYETATTAWHGQTGGKLAVQIRVVDHRSGAEPKLVQAFVRASVFPVVLLFLELIGVLPMLALLVYVTAIGDQAHRRGLLDRVAGTAVVRVTE